MRTEMYIIIIFFLLASLNLFDIGRGIYGKKRGKKRSG